MRKAKRTLRGVLLLIILIIGILFFCHHISNHKSMKVPSSKQSTKWNLVLVNDRNKLPSGYSVDLIELDNGERVHKDILIYLQPMFDDMRAEGYNPEVTSGFRTKEEQQKLYDEAKEKYKLTRLAEKWVAKPGYSEHETGLALDINGLGGSYSYDIYNWLKENSYKYGFIIRYGKDKEGVTGISYEPWHIRYVGKEVATIMKEQDLSLEEYLSKY